MRCWSKRKGRRSMEVVMRAIWRRQLRERKSRRLGNSIGSKITIKKCTKSKDNSKLKSWNSRKLDSWAENCKRRGRLGNRKSICNRRSTSVSKSTIWATTKTSTRTIYQEDAYLIKNPRMLQLLRRWLSLRNKNYIKYLSQRWFQPTCTVFPSSSIKNYFDSL